MYGLLLIYLAIGFFFNYRIFFQVIMRSDDLGDDGIRERLDEVEFNMSILPDEVVTATLSIMFLICVAIWPLLALLRLATMVINYIDKD